MVLPPPDDITGNGNSHGTVLPSQDHSAQTIISGLDKGFSRLLKQDLSGNRAEKCCCFVKSVVV